MFNFGWLTILILVYPLWGLVTPLLVAGTAAGLVGCIIASIGMFRGRAPWYECLKYLTIGLLSFAIWRGVEDLFNDHWRRGELTEWIVFAVAALPTTVLLLLRVRRWLTDLWQTTNGNPAAPPSA